MKMESNAKVRGGGVLPVEILWTGGFDSTFRIVQLSRLDISIQPYYLSDKRKSEVYELNAISEITELLQKHRDTRCKFLPLKILDMSERKERIEITDAWKRLLSHDYLGSQYDWLGCFSLEHKGIELSIHQDDKAIIVINKYGALKKVYDEVLGEYFIVDKDKSNEDVVTVFQNYHLPLAEMTKLDMKKYYVENGYEEVMNKTWFCYFPIHGKPCGKCNPCNYTIEEGMTERFTKWALLLNKLSKTRIYKTARTVLKR